MASGGRSAFREDAPDRCRVLLGAADHAVRDRLEARLRQVAPDRVQRSLEPGIAGVVEIPEPIAERAGVLARVVPDPGPHARYAGLGRAVRLGCAQPVAQSRLVPFAITAGR